MLRSLMIYLGVSEDRAESVLAQEETRQSRTRLVESAEGGELYIREAFPRAWRLTGVALDRVGFAVEDRDRSAGKYYVRFLGAGSKEEEGWFDWMFGDDEDPLVGQSFVVSVDTLDATDVAIRIQQQAPEDGTELSAFERKDEQALLTLIKGNID
jgi:outer membrane protein assembly factor BamC